MANENTFDYLYVQDWEDGHEVHTWTVMNRIKLNPGVKGEDFEKFMADDGFSKVSSVSTRVGTVIAQSLFKQGLGAPGRVETLDVDLSSFATRTSVASLAPVCSWHRT